MKYTITEYLNHLEQAKQESLAWQDARDSFKTDRERAAFDAAFSDGARHAISLVKLHGGFSFHAKA